MWQKTNSVSVLDEELERALQGVDLAEVYHFYKICRHWDIIVGKPLSLKTAPKHLIGGTLTITVGDAAYAHHLRYFVDTVIKHAASPVICGENAVRRIRFQVGEVKINRFIVLKEIRHRWKSIVDSPLAECCTAERLIDGQLEIAVPSCYYNELKSIESGILARIRQKCSKSDVVKKIELRRIKDSHAFRDGRIDQKAYGKALRQKTREFERFKSQHRTALDRISDAKLRDQFAKLMKGMLSLPKNSSQSRQT